MITLIVSNKEMEDIKTIVKGLEESGLLIRDVGESIENQANEQKSGFIGMLLYALGQLEKVSIFNATSSFN